jgi:dipeptide/tripeptide permease
MKITIITHKKMFQSSADICISVIHIAQLSKLPLRLAKLSSIWHAIWFFKVVTFIGSTES